jgi:hypothetical protein
MMKSVVLVALIFVASPAFGIIYSWTDSQGIEHYTNKDYEIPVRYRTRVKARFPEATDSTTPQPNLQTGTAPTEPLHPVQMGAPGSQPPVVSAEPQNNVTKRSRRERRARRPASEEE